MNKTKAIYQYFSFLDTGNVKEAVDMFDGDGKINSPSEDGLEPSVFISAHVDSAPYRRHKIMDVLIGEKGDSVAVYFQYVSKTDSEENPAYEGVDYFSFGSDGKFLSLSIFLR